MFFGLFFLSDLAGSHCHAEIRWHQVAPTENSNVARGGGWGGGRVNENVNKFKLTYMFVMLMYSLKGRIQSRTENW